MGRAVGVANGNFRAGDYLTWATQDLSNVPTWKQSIRIRELKEYLTGAMGAEAFEAWCETSPVKPDEFITACEAELDAAQHPVDAAQRIEREIEAEILNRAELEAQHNDWLDEKRTLSDLI